MKDLYEDNQNKNGKIVKNINESLINVRKSIKSKEIPENGNPKKIVNIVKNILDFNQQQKDKGRPSKVATRMKILAPKQMSQKLPIPLAQLKAGNTSKNLLNETRQIIYSPYRAKEIASKLFYNIMNSIKL